MTYANNVNGVKGKKSLEELKDYETLLITGIANPEPLVDFLSSKNLKINHLKYSDHHNFSKEEIMNINTEFEKISTKNKLILTTEKDYVRLRKHLDIYFLEIEIAFLANGDKFDKTIHKYVG